MNASVRTNRGGFSLIEVLVTLVVTTLGLLGIAALQAKLQLSEVDAYQRAQALLLAQNMADRITTNRKNAAAYDTGILLGAPGDGQPTDCATIASPTTQKIDSCEWSNALKGAAEATAGGTLTGAMVGARGCVDDLGGDGYLVSVVWQGLTPLSRPPDGIICGVSNSDYGGAGTPCANGVCIRAISTMVHIGAMD